MQDTVQHQRGQPFPYHWTTHSHTLCDSYEDILEWDYDMHKARKIISVVCWQPTINVRDTYFSPNDALHPANTIAAKATQKFGE